MITSFIANYVTSVLRGTMFTIIFLMLTACGSFGDHTSPKPDLSTPVTTASIMHADSPPLTRKDVIDTIKLVSTEVDGSLPDDIFIAMTQATADVVWNRLMTGRYGTTVAEVASYPWAFSAIRSNLPDAYGNLDNMPETAIKRRVAVVVKAWMIARSNGAASRVGGALNFLNPNFSSARSLASWGWDVVRQAEENHMVWGKGKSIHYYGTSRDLMKLRPQPFRLVLPNASRSAPHAQSQHHEGSVRAVGGIVR